MGNKILLYKQLLLLSLCWLFQLQLIAQQSGNWILSKVINANTGLAQNSVNALYLDSRTGFLWIGTEGGLTVYNGVTAKNYDTRNAPSLKMARILNFYSTYDNEVLAFDRTARGVVIQGDSVSMQRYADYSPYINFSNLPGIKDTGYNSRLAQLEKKAGEQLNWHLFINDSTSLALSANSVYKIGKTASKFNFSFPDFQHPAYNLEIDKTRMLILQKDFGAYIVDSDKKTVVPVKLKNPEILKGSPVIYSDRVNHMHTLLNDKSVYKLKLKNDTLYFEPFAILPEIPLSISCISIHPDNNRIFIGSLEKGVFMYAKSLFYTYQFNDRSKYIGDKKNPLNPQLNILYASVLLGPGRLHVFCQPGTPRAIELNLDDGFFKFSRVASSSPMQIAIDAKKNMYTEDVDFKRYAFSNATGKDHAFKNLNITAFCYDAKHDKVWGVDRNENRLLFFNDDSYTEYMRLPSRGETGFLTCLRRLNDVLLVNSLDKIFRIDETNKKLELIYDFKEPLVRDVYVDKENYIWISTYGKGIYMYDQDLKKLYHPPIDPGGNLAFSHSFIEDGKDNFLIPTNNGLYHIPRKALISLCKDSTQALFYHYYDISNGLLTNEFNGGCYPAFNKLPNGDILVPSMQGMVRIFTSSLTKPRVYPLFIQKVSTPRNNYAFQNNMSFQSNERILTWEVNFAQWEYSAASGLSYRLDDETSWTPLNSGERKIILSELKGGNHTLRIRNQFDLEGKKLSQLAVNFYIAKRYYEKAWFWLLITLALMFVIYLAAHLRSLQLRRANLALERKIRSKTIEIQNKNSNLEKTLADLNTAMGQLERNSQFQQKLIGLLGHDIMTPLKSINKVAEQLINYRQKLKEETTTSALVDIGNTATQLLFLGESIIHWIKVQEGQFLPRYSCFELHSLVDEISSLHQPLADEKKNRILNKIPEVLLCVQDATIIKIILHNLLLNANKFTINGAISISASVNSQKLELSVTDTGVGMDTNIVDKLNNMKTGFSEKGTNNEEGWGLGYSFIIAMIQLVKGKLFIQSTKGAGTRVSIEFPVVQ